MKVKTKHRVVECAKTWATHCNLIFVFIVNAYGYISGTKIKTKPNC